MAQSVDEVWFRESSNFAPFVITVDNESFFDVEKRLLCLHFDIEAGPLVIVEREEFDKDMDLMRTIL